MAALNLAIAASHFYWSACASAPSPGAIDIHNTIDGRMKISDYFLSQKNDPVILSIELGVTSLGKDCPCKSSLVKYSALQKKIDGQTSPLLEGKFSIFGITKIELPIAIQPRLIFKDMQSPSYFHASRAAIGILQSFVIHDKAFA